MTGSRGAHVARFGLLLAVALVLHGVERLVPTPFPFVRIGLANVATVLALVALGFRDALLLTVLRVALASVIGGLFLGPAFAMSMAGGLAAVAVMGAARRAAFPPLGVVGLSLLGAAAHNAAQLAVVAGFYAGWHASLRLLPAALLLAAATGLVTGFIAFFAIERLSIADPLRA